MLVIIGCVLILLPFVLFDQSIQNAVERLVAAGRTQAWPAFVLALLLVTDVLLPVPSSLTATATGMLYGLAFGTLVNWVGMQSGAMLGYGLGRFAVRGAVKRFIGQAALENAAKSHQRWGSYSLIITRSIPVLAEGSVVFAGLVRMPVLRFALWTGVSNAAIAMIYASVGAYALEVRVFLLAFAGAITIPAIMMAVHHLLQNWRHIRISKHAGSISRKTHGVE